MNILITGGTGFIGHALVNSLLKEGHKVTVLSRTPDSVNKIIGNKLTTLSNLDQLSSSRAGRWIRARRRSRWTAATGPWHRAASAARCPA